ncbi:MAG: alginate lyase family protein, partial [Clostridia bacterium]|nr:alginate lyase family protein [Clostridia bacterium]
ENEDTTIKYTNQLEKLFDVIEPQNIGLDYKQAIDNEDYEAAINICAGYYRNKADLNIAELSAEGPYNVLQAENAARGIMREVNIDWEFQNGDIDFLFDPTEIKGPRNPEWLFQFNRHSYWANMARTYNAIGDEKYAKAFRRQLLKWIAQTDIPEKWNSIGSAWRTIECGIRLLGAWQIAFNSFRKSQSLENITILLMIASMYRQSLHLVNNPTGGNWLMMESNGVYTFSALFPELSDSKQNRNIAASRILQEIKEQILPDGMHNELSPDYQGVVFNCISNFYSLAVSLGYVSEIDSGLVELIRKTVNAAILLSTPALTQPRTNDCYTIKTKMFTERAEKLLGETPEYTFFNSNRASGNAPKGETASAFLPYAGFAVMRSGWDADAAYLCFDVGPLGKAHIHQDKLNINIYKGNEELIYDDGGGQYEFSSARNYAVSGYGHNIVLVDGLAQSRKAPILSEKPVDIGWITNNEFDYAASVYDDTFGDSFVKPATHKREIRFCKPEFFCVSDTLTSVDGKCHDYELLYHLDTQKIKALKEYNNGVISQFGKNYEIAIIPIDDNLVEPCINVASGVTEPIYRGWYNGRNDCDLHKAATVSRLVKGVKDYRFTTLLFPLTLSQELPEIVKLSNGVFKILFNGKTYTIDLNGLNKSTI